MSDDCENIKNKKDRIACRNMSIAHAFLEQAGRQLNSESPVREYIRFMDSLPEDERTNILSNKKTTELVDKLNTLTERQIELNKNRRKIYDEPIGPSCKIQDNLDPLERAREAKKQNVLNKQFRFVDGGIASYKEKIDRGDFVKGELKQVPSVKYNRVKFNRMDAAEQSVYEEKMKITKPEYRLYNKDGTFNVVSKTIYDYALEVGF